MEPRRRGLGVMVDGRQLEISATRTRITYAAQPPRAPAAEFVWGPIHRCTASRCSSAISRQIRRLSGRGPSEMARPPTNRIQPIPTRPQGLYQVTLAVGNGLGADSTSRIRTWARPPTRVCSSPTVSNWVAPTLGAQARPRPSALPRHLRR